MHLQVNGLNISLTETLLAHVDKRFRFALDRIEDQITRVSVRLGDNNGPRGGDDKHCKVIVTLRNGGTVILSERGESFYNVIDRASEKTKRLVNKNTEKKRSRRRQEPMLTGTNGDEGIDGDEGMEGDE